MRHRGWLFMPLMFLALAALFAFTGCTQPAVQEPESAHAPMWWCHLPTTQACEEEATRNVPLIPPTHTARR